LSVKKCKSEHEPCKKTLSNKIYGQNLFSEITSGRIENDINQLLVNVVLSWYNEKKESSQADINQCCGGYKFSKIGHFLQVIQDKVTSIGCAAARFTKNGETHILATCNYSHPNVVGKPTYVSGNSASQCPSGRDLIFMNLCNS
jgi:hypothetical protein